VHLGKVFAELKASADERGKWRPHADRLSIPLVDALALDDLQRGAFDRPVEKH
jgi:hypothetical protein